MRDQQSIDLAEWGNHAAEIALMFEFTLEWGRWLLDVPIGERRELVAVDGRYMIPGELEVNAAFDELVGRRFPGDDVLGEGPRPEAVGSRAWTIKLAGTSAYLAGLREWAIGIAFLIDGEPVAGMVGFPTGGTWYAASTERPGAYRNDEPIAVATGPAAVVAGSGVNPRHSATITDSLILAIAGGAGSGRLSLVRVLSTLSPLARGCAVADGGIDGAVYDGEDPCEVAPLVPILRGLGLKITDGDGNEQRYDRFIKGAVISRGEPDHRVLVAAWRNHRDRDAVPIEELGLTTRPYNRLKSRGVHTISQLTAHTGPRLLTIPGFDSECLEEVRARLAERGLSLRE